MLVLKLSVTQKFICQDAGKVAMDVKTLESDISSSVTEKLTADSS